MMFTWMVIAVHLCTLESFGVPYMSPVTPLRVRDMGDHVYRRPWTRMGYRPYLPAEQDRTRNPRTESRDSEDK